MGKRKEGKARFWPTSFFVFLVFWLWVGRGRDGIFFVELFVWVIFVSFFFFFFFFFFGLLCFFFLFRLCVGEKMMNFL